MHPLLRNAVIGVVGLILAGALTALALFGGNSGLSVLAMLAAALLASVIGLFLYAQGWTWGSRAARRRQGGTSLLIALGGGLMALVAAVALAGLLILVLLFFLG
jgi:putative flippase GtrA